jgi:hypothetical protein
LKGSVLQVRPARHLHHNGQLRIVFHEVVLPDGTVQRMDTSLEGIQTGEAGPVSGGATAFKLVGIIVGLAVRSHTLAIVTSAYGGSRSIYSNFLGRGRNIVFPKNTAMEIGFGDRTPLPMPAGR